MSNKKEIKKKRKMKKSIKLVICILIFIISIILLILYLFYQKPEKHQPVPKKEIKKEVEAVDPKMEEVKNLYKENNDLYGWIKIEGTRIDHPIMYTQGEDYYLRKDFYKQYYEGGTPYIDKHNTVSPRDINLIIYGHNLKDGTMFNDLLNYEKEEYYKEHKKITLYTIEEKQEYEIVSVFLSKVYRVNDKVFKYYKFYNANNEKEYNNYINNIKNLSLYETNVKPCYNDELITLSTCEYSQENGRFVVVARKVTKDSKNC